MHKLKSHTIKIRTIAFMKIFLSLVVCLFIPLSVHSQQAEYKLVVHNVENMFDADGVAVFSDYQPFDEDGEPLYTPAHLLTKIQKTTRLMARYNGGAGPDIIMLVEIEADYTPLPGNEQRDANTFLEQYRDTTVEYMLGEGINDEIKDLPAELLLLKGMYDAGLTGYDVAVAYDRAPDGRPRHVQKNVLFSKLPIQHERTRSIPIEDARPILEAWVDVEGYELALFVNHWKSRASDEEIEKIRVQNAEVLKARLDELRSENPHVDFILGGDFNSDYNQSHRYQYMDKTAVNDVLRSTGDERFVKQGNTDAVYNLWYEHPIDKRGSDVFRGYWGTLMQIMIGPGLYDYHGIQYVDGSFDVGRFPGKNVYENSLTPRRWHTFENGGGYSDHLPISMRFIVTDRDATDERITLEYPGYVDDENWEPIAISYSMPDSDSVLFPEDYDGENLRSLDYFDKLLVVETNINRDYTVTVNGEQYQLWSPTFNTRDQFANVSGTDESVRFIGRLGKFRGNWQFVIESEEYLDPEFNN